jgi:hypothetical protein
VIVVVVVDVVIVCWNAGMGHWGSGRERGGRKNLNGDGMQ